MKKVDCTRRTFLKGSLAAAIIDPLTAAAVSENAEKGSLLPSPGQGPGSAPPTVGQVNGMPYRFLGTTGVKVSLLGVGGYHIGMIPSPKEAIALIRIALDEGVNFLDNAWEYHDGQSEERMGKALEDGYRSKAFLMTKVCARNEIGAMENLEDSLRRMKTDVIDLWQFHEVDFDNHPDMIFARKGAIHAAIKAKEQGKIRFIGFTGHKSPRIHLKMLRTDFPWDAVQMPINIMDAYYQSFAREVVPVLVERKIGVVAMKTAASGAIVRGTKVSAAECLRYAMSLPVSVVISGMNNKEMARQNIAATKAFNPMNEKEIRDLLAKVREVAGDGRLERFKTSTDFDSEIHLGQH